jgi:hypothetical protein
MATTTQAQFTQALKKYYSFYTGGFLLFIIVLALAEQMGLPKAWIGYIFLFATIALYAGIGIMSRTADVAEYYVAGRRVPAVFNGMATAADWMSAASFIGMAGGLYILGYDGLAFIMGWTGGYVLVALFLAPYLRKFGQSPFPTSWVPATVAIPFVRSACWRPFSAPSPTWWHRCWAWVSSLPASPASNSRSVSSSVSPAFWSVLSLAACAR